MTLFRGLRTLGSSFTLGLYDRSGDEMQIRHPVGLRSLLWAAVFSMMIVPAYAQTPAIASISPNASLLCGALATLTVTGSNFVQGSYVRFNGAIGSPLATTFIDANHLTTHLLQNAECVTGGTLSVTVVSPNGEVSPPVDFVIQGPGATTYAYTGSTFVYFWGGFACPPECRITGSFTVAEPLAPNLFNFAVVPASWIFSDGYSTASGTNTLFTSLPIRPGSNDRILVWTDSTGKITSWDIGFGVNGDDMVTGATFFTQPTFFFDVIGTGCASCAGAAGATSNNGIVSSPLGTWSSFPGSLSAPLKITTTSLRGALSGQQYSATITATGGSGTGYNWSVSSGVPPGFTLSSEGNCGAACTNVVLSSTGDPAAPVNCYDFTVQVADSAGNSKQQLLTLVVLDAFSVSFIPDAALSKDNIPTSLHAAFTAPNNQTLQHFANSCHFVGFDWVQTITQDSPAAAYSKTLCDQATGTRTGDPGDVVAQLGPFYGDCAASIPWLQANYADPPLGGYTYQFVPNNLNVLRQYQPNFDRANPFYYSPLVLLCHKQNKLM